MADDDLLMFDLDDFLEPKKWYMPSSILKMLETKTWTRLVKMLKIRLKKIFMLKIDFDLVDREFSLLAFERNRDDTVRDAVIENFFV